VLEPYSEDAVTVKVYAVPFVSPDTVIGDAPVPVMLPGLDVAVYVALPAVPALPAVYATVADALPAVAVPIVGAAGLIPGLTEFEAEDVLEPYAFVAVTVNVYVVPRVRPVGVIGDEPLPLAADGLEATV
jgi:hypothetical protein